MTTPTLATLESERYINVETFKRDGNGVKTPVWFAVVDRRIYVFTDGTSFKVKRLGRNTKARIAACDARGKVHGSWADAEGRIVEDADEEGRAYAAIRARYGWQMRLLDLGSRLGGRIGRRKVLAFELDTARA
jgi:PPOX class probable F420-dependent enzyme